MLASEDRVEAAKEQERVRASGLAPQAEAVRTWLDSLPKEE